jgi:hypothetical protein
MHDSTSKGRRWFFLVLMLPYVVLLYPPLYNAYDPTFLDIPFFYWYQMLCIILTALLTILVYFTTD